MAEYSPFPPLYLPSTYLLLHLNLPQKPIPFPDPIFLAGVHHELNTPKLTSSSFSVHPKCEIGRERTVVEIFLKWQVNWMKGTGRYACRSDVCGFVRFLLVCTLTGHG